MSARGPRACPVAVAAMMSPVRTPDRSDARYTCFMPEPSRALTDAEVRKIATLARLDLSDEQVAACREGLGVVLGYMGILGELDLDGVEPMSHPGEATNRLDEDVPGETLTTEQFMRMAPATMPPYLKVPKVLGGDAGGA